MADTRRDDAALATIDIQLVTVLKLRERAMDDLAENLIRIDSCTKRLEVLIDRRCELANGETAPA